MRIIETSILRPDDQLSQDENDWIYNGLDVCVTLEIVNELLTQLDNVSSKTYNFSLALQGPVMEMSVRGILVDEPKRRALLSEYRHRIKHLEEILIELVGSGIGITELNWRSPTQLKHLFYHVLGLPPVKKRNTNGVFAPTTNRDAMEKLSSYFIAEPLCATILAMRDLDKKRQFLETGIDPDGRMRTSFNIAGTNSGRLASSMSAMGTGTNLQNVDRELREIFIAEKGKKFGNLDLEQADARNVGALCGTYFFQSHGPDFAFRYLDACEGGDLHTGTCKLAWRELSWTHDAKGDRAVADMLAYRQDSFRQLAKKLGHGTNYYGTPRTMAKHTKMPVSVIDDFQRRYFAGYPCIEEWHNRVRRMVTEDGSITTLFGRRRYFFGRPSEASTLREAIAYAPQSMTADEINRGMLNVFRGGYAELLCQVHDSILIQYPEDQEDKIIARAKKDLEVHLELPDKRDFHVPVDTKTGWNWGDRVEKKDGTITNPDGLDKWKSHDPRERSLGKKLTVKNLLL